MKTALITTTINVPTVLALYRKLDPSVHFFVAADHKTPEQAYEFCADIPDCDMYSPERQKDCGYSCSELFGWNNDSRRNIALLEALKWGADLLISVDDDMIPWGSWAISFRSLFFTPSWIASRDPEWFQPVADWHSTTWSGLQFGQKNQWFDAGMFTIPPARQRGLPVDRAFAPGVEPIVNARIGAAQGIILGVPDTDAMTAITNEPKILGVTDILRNGFVVHPQAHAVFNSQLTAFRRELAPAFAQFYNHHGRNTDIIASMLMRRVMQERNLYTYFGPPMGFHARQPRPLLKDLQAEMFGLTHIDGWAEYLTRAPLPEASVTEQCRLLVAGSAMWTDDAKEAAMAWYADVEKVL